MKRAFTAFLNACKKGIRIRTTGDSIAIAPPFITSHAQIDQ